MTRTTKALTTLGVFTLTFLILGSVSFAGDLLNHPLAYNDGNGPAGGAWTGTGVYDNYLTSPYHLYGTVDYCVMTAADFATAFPTVGQLADPVTGQPYTAGDSLVYMYQLHNQADFAVSTYIASVNDSANTQGQFGLDAADTAASGYLIDTGDNAYWLFGSPQLSSGKSSYILAYSSNNEPVFGTSMTVDGGSYGLTSVLVPGDTPIPEPTGLTLMAAGLLAFVGRRRNR